MSETIKWLSVFAVFLFGVATAARGDEIPVLPPLGAPGQVAAPTTDAPPQAALGDLPALPVPPAVKAAESQEKPEGKPAIAALPDISAPVADADVPALPVAPEQAAIPPLPTVAEATPKDLASKPTQAAEASPALVLPPAPGTEAAEKEAEAPPPLPLPAAITDKPAEPEPAQKTEEAQKEDEKPAPEKRATAMKPLRNANYNFRRQMLPGAIYADDYSRQNRHLPRRVTYQDYEAMAFSAAAQNNVNGLRALLQEGVDVNSTGPSGETLLATALRSGASGAAALLQARGAGH